MIKDKDQRDARYVNCYCEVGPLLYGIGKKLHKEAVCQYVLEYKVFIKYGSLKIVYVEPSESIN